MRPDAAVPNGFERALLERIAADEPALAGSLERLRVVKRELTGVGSFTTFACAGAGDATQLGLNALIEMPGVPSGMGAVLFCRGGEPEMLEVYTFGSEPWDGDPAGFSIGAAG